MKVLFKKTNEIKDVSFGYAVNYLIPHGLAVVATDKTVGKIDQNQRALAKARSELDSKLKQLAQELEGKVVIIEAEAGKSGKLFGSVTKKEILEALELKNGKINVLFDKPIKKVGEYKVELKLGAHRAKIVVEVKG